ncbi:MAG TPA: ferredoxin [Steroidobacteraceae bacterium]|jgi:ferredoxin|nr:ferredoxin [Steroidobacteraceae bacterium]
MSRLRVTVNPVKCQAYKRCSAIAPAVFALGPDGKAMVLQPDAAPDEEVVKAARSCPYRAITVAVDATDEQIFPPLPKSPSPK